TTGWYDMLKQHAPNHLISIAVEDGGIFNWDPMVLKCDFFEPHPYPVLKNYEKDAAANGYNVYAAGLNQMLGKFYWFKNFLPRPWMIGETGFKAIANPPNIYEYDGTLAEQSNYCNDAYTATVDCDGVGLSWWWYQDIFWPNAADGFGLMNHGDIVPYSLATFNLFDKPSVTTITNLNYSSLSPNVCNPPPNYSDPYNNAYFSTACPPGNIVTGTVTDVNGNPIEGAIVIGHTYTEWGHNNNSNIFFPIDNVSYTFTDASGYYELTPFDSKNPTVPARQYIRWIDCTALGAEPKKINDWGWWPDPSPPANEPPPPPAITGTQNFTLKTINTKINAIVQNVTINTSSVPYKAFKTLTATNNVIIQNGGSVDFVANNEVNIQTEFHAANGSEVHIYNERVFADCNEINSLGFRETGYSVTENLSSTKNPIEVSFIKAKTLETATVIPNPNNGTFDIIFNSENESKKEVMVYNATGSLILSRTFTESKMEMDLTLLAKGIYFIKIKTELSSFHQKIIIQ
ncbi:MAG TPA: T9SS type A sorting domain-containing protein, partial [Bacteroidia bacterium]|nr:T9SS type A sorting domain-containing protein [Bacteroidia bacterium]